MTEPMSPERFAALAQAYGGIDRWPAELRTAGWHLAAADPACAQALAQAEALDFKLAAWTVAPPTPALRQHGGNGGGAVGSYMAVVVGPSAWARCWPGPWPGSALRW
jgi:hypothetical protein